MVVILILVPLVSYFVTGFMLARMRLPVMWEKARENWYTDKNIRESVKAQFFGITVGWPVYFPVAAMSRILGNVVTEGDPQEIARRMDEKDKELRERELCIREMEREMGIG
jgi:hypothetical protein